MEENHTEQLSIFEAPPTDTAIQSREWVEFRPVNQITDYSAVEFQISPLSSGYMDLKNSALKLKLRLTDDSNQPVNEEDNVALVNLALHSIFSQADCTLQQTGIGQVGTNYPYKAYLDTILNTSKNEETALESQLYCKDQIDPDSAEPNGVNGGLYKRFIYTRQGNVIDLEGPVMLDIFQQDRLIVNGVSLFLKFWPSKNAFRLLSVVENASYKVQIVDASFKLCVQKPNPAVLMAHAKEIKSTPAIYPHVCSVVKIASVAKGEFSYTADNMFQGEVPSQLILGFVASSAYSGDYKRNPFNFQPFNCNFVALYVDGQSYPAKPLQPDFQNKNYVDAYKTLTNYNKEVNIDRLDYAHGFTLFILDVNPELVFNTKRKGHCRLEVRFASSLQESITLLMYRKFPRVLYIDEARTVFLQ